MLFRALQVLAELLAAVAAPWDADCVLAPSTAGVALAGSLADRLGIGLQLAALNDRGRPTAFLGATPPAGTRTLLVNDVVTTGEGLRQLAAMARGAGSEVAGAAWFASRSNIDVATLIGAPAAWVASLELAAVEPERCPACADERPLEDALDLN
jgi:orotate phosphoribosyltransferase